MAQTDRQTDVVLSSKELLFTILVRKPKKVEKTKIAAQNICSQKQQVKVTVETHQRPPRQLKQYFIVTGTISGIRSGIRKIPLPGHLLPGGAGADDETQRSEDTGQWLTATPGFLYHQV